jgi:hypothetical protein
VQVTTTPAKDGKGGKGKAAAEAGGLADAKKHDSDDKEDSSSSSYSSSDEDDDKKGGNGKAKTRRWTASMFCFLTNGIVHMKEGFLHSEDVLSGDEIDNGDKLKFWNELAVYLLDPSNQEALSQVFYLSASVFLHIA